MSLIEYKEKEPAMSGIHSHPIEVRFGDCDPAGVVYFPRYFDWFHQAMETWFDEALDLPYAQVLQRHGFPAVHTEADFRSPCRMGDRVRVELRVGTLGASSFRLDYRVIGSDETLRTLGHTVVTMIGVVADQPDHFRPQRIPEDLRGRIERFVSARTEQDDI
jgi:4-hydroxybenzoyl-CoA thioesterase